MDRYYVYYYRTKAKVADMRVFITLREFEDWLFRTKQLNKEDIIITNIIANSRYEKLETYLENEQIKIQERIIELYKTKIKEG